MHGALRVKRVKPVSVIHNTCTANGTVFIKRTPNQPRLKLLHTSKPYDL